MSGKTAREKRKDQAAETMLTDPQVLWQKQAVLIRTDGAIEGLEAGVKVAEGALKSLQEGLGALKAERRKLLAEVEKLQKAAGIDGKAKPPADDAATAEAAPPAA